MKKKIVFCMLGWAAALAAAAGDFTLESTGQDTRVTYRGKPLVKSVTTQVLKNGKFAPDAKFSSAVLPDGSKVFNIWSENHASDFRQECALSADGNVVEITYAAFNDANNRYQRKTLELVLPYELFEGGKFEALYGNGRRFNKCEGSFDPTLKSGAIYPQPLRFMAVTKGDMKLIFDFNPLGPGDYIHGWQQGNIRGVWEVLREGDNLILRQRTSLAATGNMTGSKIRIMRGSFEDYFKLHALKTYTYIEQLPAQNQFSFGATATGKNYIHADCAVFSGKKRFGWLDPAGIKAFCHSPQGAYYSHVTGTDKTFRIGGLNDGIHIITIGAGNFGGTENSFSVALNGVPMLKEPLNIPKGKTAVLSQAVRVSGGQLDVKFTGKFILSSLSTQFLLADAEDFFLRRAFWVSNGYEPLPQHRNDDWIPAPESFPGAINWMEMPVPGQETAGTPRRPERITEVPAANDPAMAWRYNANMMSLHSGICTLNEWRDPATLDRYLKKLKSDGVNALMVSGIFSYHTFFPKTVERDFRLRKNIYDAAHANGMKVVDHHDAPVCWNGELGFRTVCERISEMEIDRETGTPNHRFCIMNPDFRKAYFNYACKLVELGADGLQIDEVYFFQRGCLCAFCRKKFHEDTGWYLPLNELDPALSNKFSPLHKRWTQWKIIQQANWYAELRRELKKVNPHVSLSLYTTHYGWLQSKPRVGLSTDMEEHIRAIDFFGTEVMTRNPPASARALVPMRKVLNLLRFSANVPIWGIFYNNHHDARYFSYAVSNMNGQQALLPYFPPPAGKTDFQKFSSHPDNMNRMQAQVCAEVALLFSRSGRDWNSGIGMASGCLGIAQTLEEMHIPYLIIGESALDAQKLARFKVLYIGSAGSLDDEQISVIKTYAQNGGTVLLNDIAGGFDEIGERRKQWGFADVFGFNLRGRAVNVTEINGADGKKLTLKTPVMYFIPKPLLKEDSNYSVTISKDLKAPLFIERQFGKGRMIYQPSQLEGKLYALERGVGLTWEFERDAVLAGFLRARLAEVIGSARLWTTDAPEKVYTTIYTEKTGCWCIF